MNGIGTRLTELRKKRGLTQQAVANRAGVTKAVISSYERSLRIPSCNVLIKLADLYGTSTDYILGRTAESNPFFKGLSAEDIRIVTELIDYIKKKNK